MISLHCLGMELEVRWRQVLLGCPSIIGALMAVSIDQQFYPQCVLSYNNYTADWKSASTAVSSPS